IVLSATSQEVLPAYNFCSNNKSFAKKGLSIQFYSTGVGMLATTVQLMKLIAKEKPDLIIQAGIAGSFDTSTQLGKVVVVEHEIIGDLGVEENGQWKDLFNLKFQQANQFPFKKKLLTNKNITQLNLLKLPVVTAITVNEITTNAFRIEQLKKKYQPAIESMEGAALHYVCLDANIAFLQIRSLSNYVGERDKTKWQLQKSIQQLNRVVLKYLKHFTK
ncbi:MAG: futalosine hydrolase, partial [Chitinophagaceae bacterium]|nr:futalosine hydrolase [Chitinophagaceae bacterium]